LAIIPRPFETACRDLRPPGASVLFQRSSFEKPAMLNGLYIYKTRGREELNKPYLCSTFFFFFPYYFTVNKFLLLIAKFESFDLVEKCI